MKTIPEMELLRYHVRRMIHERRRFETLKRAKPDSLRVRQNRAELDLQIEAVRRLASEL